MLLNEFPNAEFTFVDIAEGMLKVCVQKTDKQIKDKNISAKFAICNIEKAIPKSKFDLVISNLTFQWVKNFTTTLKKIDSSIDKNGIFLFSTLVEPTFLEIKNLFRDVEIEFPGPLLQERKLLEEYCIVKYDIFTEYFDDLQSFFRQLKSLGAVNATKNPVPFKKLRNLIKLFNHPPLSTKTSMKNNIKLPANYTIAFSKRINN
jgi:malonyl-CoA O-methyltransferase